MGRTRQYASPTERQTDYRQRMHATTVWVNRAPYERMTNAMEQLQRAVSDAHHHGSPLARGLYRSNELDTLEAAVAWLVQHLHHEQEEQR